MESKVKRQQQSKSPTNNITKENGSIAAIEKNMTKLKRELIKLNEENVLLREINQCLR